MIVLGRAALALVFVGRRRGKLADRPGSPPQPWDSGCRRGWPGRSPCILPIVELTVAGALLWRPTVAPGAAAGLFLLVLFTCLIVLSLRQGRRPACHCFGRVGDPAPIGTGTLVRNIVLMALAVFVLLTA